MIRNAFDRSLTMAALRRRPHAPVVRIRASSSFSEAREKLRGIMEDYRQANYTQTIPSRFIKTVLDAADENHDGKVSVKEVEKLLKNIGASDRMTRDEIGAVMVELGCSSCGDHPEDGISVEVIQEMYLENRKSN